MFEFLRQRFTNYCEGGISENASTEERRRIFVINLFALVGMLLTLIMGIQAWLSLDIMLATVLHSSTLVFLAAHISIRYWQNYAIPSRLVLYCLSALMLYLIYSGGVNNTGTLWIFILPAVALFLGGLTIGLINVVIFILSASFLLFFHDGLLLATSYNEDYKIRLLLSFCTVTFLSCCYEYSRKQSYKHIQMLSDKYEKLSKIDPLTGLSNRREMMEQINKEYNRAKRHHQAVSILLCDVDHFKQINDTYGHETGDIVLQQLSAHFQTLVRRQDSISRWGGEEFLFMLPETEIQAASKAAEKIRSHISRCHFNIPNFTGTVTVSIGVTQLQESRSITESIAKADKCLYQAKQGGRDKVVSE
ncbi:GGDEF domain-containing protein [Catenovulum sediminis]|uniref:diguanylate cyclase n=1 Tax=Catenovulum sediminis TaxID=1740262 RepID=A0ABV1REL5_9ALTE|nr:GGDEF domain-containing protein [Catenovulum sediminis]